jgi:ABC-type Fe3+-hydroxamate transport system substrate-binding protein
VRVVSLVPSVTETLTAWGHPPIACTQFCERPDLPHVGGTKNPDIAAIVDLAPDLVVLDRQENRRQDADALRAAALELVVLDVRSFAGLADDLAQLASAVGADPPTPAALPLLEPLASRAFVPIWHRPWMTIGPDTYGSAVLAALGVTNVFADAAEDYPGVTIADVLGRQPDVVLVPSEPYVFRAPHVAELEQLARVVRVDGQDLFWWGARTESALHRLHASIRAGLTAE